MTGDDTSSSLSLLSLSLSKSSGTVNIPLYIHQLTDARYITKVKINMAPTILPRYFAMHSPKIADVTSKRRAVYIFELVSNVVRPGGKNNSPREKAPRIFEMVEPTTLPMAREERPCATEAITTAS